MPKCTYCGADIPSGERYCPVCRAAIPRNYENKDGSYSGTYGHDDCWEIDESRYRRWDEPNVSRPVGSQSFDSSAHAGTDTNPRTVPPREWKPSASAGPAVSGRNPRPAASRQKKTQTGTKANAGLRIASLILLFVTWSFNPFPAIPLILFIIGVILDMRRGSGKVFYLLSIACSVLIFVLLTVFLIVGDVDSVIDIFL